MADGRRAAATAEELLAPLRVAAEATENAAHLLRVLGPPAAADGAAMQPTGEFAQLADDFSAAILVMDHVADRLQRRATRAAGQEPEGAARLEVVARKALAVARIGLRHRPGDADTSGRPGDPAGGRARSRSPRRGRTHRLREQLRPAGADRPNDTQD